MKSIQVQIATLLADAYATRVNNLTRSVDLATKALNLSREIHDQALIAKSLNQLSLYFMIMGDYPQSTATAEEAISYFEKLDDEKGIADAKYNIAGIYYKTDNYHLGIIFLTDALKIYHKYNDWHNESRVEKSLGTIYEYIGDQNNAVASYEKAIEAAKKANDMNLESNAYNNLSGVRLKQGRTEEALEMIEWSIAMKKRTGDTRGYAFAIYGRGKVRSAMEQHSKAESDFLEAVKVHRDMGERLGLGMVYNKLGILYLTTGQLEKAKKTAEKGYAFSNKFNMAIIKVKCAYLLYKIHKQQNDPPAALDYLERYQREKESVINTQTLKVIENYEIIIRIKTLEKEAELQKEKAEIIEKKNRAEQAVRVRQEFLSSMSHEIRTPLNAITTIITLLDRQVDEENKRLLNSLQFASNNLMRIINDILDFTKLDEGKTQLEFHPSDLKTLGENIWQTYDTLAQEKGLSLSLKSDPALATHYLLDETKLTQILGNLISNAIKYTSSGTVEIVIEKLKEERAYDNILFKVTDTGEGISESDISKIFESFTQIKHYMTKKEGGTGLGLTIVKKLVALHGSKIRVESVVGKGSVFYFELKLQRVALPCTAKPELSELLKGKNALLAEDNQINAMVILKLLSNWGVITDHVINGKQAFEKTRQKKYDFILMDIHMPEMNGLESAKLIRTRYNLNNDIPIYAVTADIMANTDAEYIPYFTDFLFKPLEIRKIYDALAKIAV